MRNSSVADWISQESCNKTLHPHAFLKRWHCYSSHWEVGSMFPALESEWPVITEEETLCNFPYEVIKGDAASTWFFLGYWVLEPSGHTVRKPRLHREVTWWWHSSQKPSWGSSRQPAPSVRHLSKKIPKQKIKIATCLLLVASDNRLKERNKPKKDLLNLKQPGFSGFEIIFFYIHPSRWQMIPKLTYDIQEIQGKKWYYISGKVV